MESTGIGADLLGWITEMRDWGNLSWQDWNFRTHQPCGWRKMTLWNVPVAPVEELLMRWAGGSVWRGGPQLMPWHTACQGLRHYRGDEPADEPAHFVEAAQQWPLETNRLFWCGPIVNHFGHQLGEFGGRVLSASLDKRPGKLLFLHPDGDQQLEDLRTWQQAWISYLNPRAKPVLISCGGFRARELVVIPQQQRLGCPPTPRHLLALCNRGRTLKRHEVKEVVVISRSRFAMAFDKASLRGSVAGERVFDAWMLSKGARIVYPETLTFQEQLELLYNAKRIVLAEGSALHALELIGRQPDKEVLVIARRPLWAGMEQPLRSRFPKMIWVDAVQELHWLEPANPRVKGVARLNWRQVMDALNSYFSWQVTDQDITTLEKASNAQLKDLHMKLPMQKRLCTANDRRPLRAGGW